MTVVACFTVVAFVALALHSWWMREVWLKRQARRELGLNGQLEVVATLFVRVEATRLVLNALLFLAGLGFLVGLRQSGWLIVVLPVISIAASVINLRGLHELRA
jgi:hypothetical protein